MWAKPGCMPDSGKAKVRKLLSEVIEAHGGHAPLGHLRSARMEVVVTATAPAILSVRQASALARFENVVVDIERRAHGHRPKNQETHRLAFDV
jgi:hypothetical protein